jgi:CheY-like chemotaxis protein
LGESQPINILLIEDDVIDVMAVRRGFRARQVSHKLTVAGDGQEGLAVLRGEGHGVPFPHPYMILLDLNLPIMNGLEFLRRLRQDPSHRRAVVFVLTTSDAEQDRQGAYDHNVAGYVVKSELGFDFAPMLDLLDSYCSLVRFP